MFLPTTRAEMQILGWEELDIILVSGDSYIDSPFIGTAVIGKVLLRAGYRVGVIAQPRTDTIEDIARLGKPRLLWGVSAGSVDSMVANYTALGKPRRTDDYTPGGMNNRRPDRATIVYANLIRRAFKPTAPIVLGGIEASLRRVAHYDFWSNTVRGSVLPDAKADFLLYGMAENGILQLAKALDQNVDPRELRGLCYLANESEIAVLRGKYIELPSLEHVREDKNAFIDMFHSFYRNNDPISARGLFQKHGNRYVVLNPPAPYQTQAELDAVYALDFERAQHPFYEQQGSVKALETIRFAVSTHRGCYGECNFCAIAVHEGRTIRWRSEESILAEAEQITRLPGFKGYLQDVGGPTANMYGFECTKKLEYGACTRKRCLYPEVCPYLKIDHRAQTRLLQKIRRIPGVKKAFVSSGIRYDMVLADGEAGREYLEEIARHHVSGQLKIAPEHTEPVVLAKMGKPGTETLIRFKEMFEEFSCQAGKAQFLTYYLIAAHPGCSEGDMLRLKRFVSNTLHIHPEQVQIFTPTPSTYSTLMYYTEMDPFTRQSLFVEKGLRGKERQKEMIVQKGKSKPQKQAG